LLYSYFFFGENGQEDRGKGGGGERKGVYYNHLLVSMLFDCELELVVLLVLFDFRAREVLGLSSPTASNSL
jgi:hypothetical protein